MSLFLNAEELRDLTGYQVAHYQANWLLANGYPFDMSIYGKPRVLRAYIEKRLGVATEVKMAQTEPDFSSWK